MYFPALSTDSRCDGQCFYLRLVIRSAGFVFRERTRLRQKAVVRVHRALFLSLLHVRTDFTIYHRNRGVTIATALAIATAKANSYSYRYDFTYMHIHTVPVKTVTIEALAEKI